MRHPPVIALVIDPRGLRIETAYDEPWEVGPERDVVIEAHTYRVEIRVSMADRDCGCVECLLGWGER